MNQPDPHHDPTALTVDEIIDEFRMAVPGDLPVEAMRAARTHREAIAPRLVEMLDQTLVEAEAGTMPDEDAYLFALYLLAEFRRPDTLPLFVRLLSLPGDSAYDLINDSIGEYGPRILADFIDDQIGIIDQLIRNRNLDEYVRWTAADTLPLLVRDGKMTREQAAAHLEHHLRWACDERDEVAMPLVCILENLGAPSSLPLIEKAFELGLIDPGSTTLDEVRESFANADSRFASEQAILPPTGIQDAIEELSHWAYFQDTDEEDDDWDLDFDDEPELSAEAQDAFRQQMIEAVHSHVDSDEEAVADPYEDAEGTVHNDGRKVGRNERCPCGSGRKYKKCCGRSSVKAE